MFRYERREKKLQARRKRMPKHGKNLSEIYKNVTLKRGKQGKDRHIPLGEPRERR